MKRLVDLLAVVTAAALWVAAQPLCAAQVAVEAVRVATAAEQTRLTLLLDGTVTHRIFTLTDPDRVVLDIPDARLTGPLPAADPQDAILVGLRSGVRDQGELRIVMDLKQPVRVKSFPLTPEGGAQQRLVVELIAKGAVSPPGKGKDVAAPPRARAPAARPVVVAIDAGHGGHDPGAIGGRGTLEKNVTLAIARRLAALVDKEPGMRPVMIREGDSFVHLHERIKKAREAKADLFISIHADAFNNPNVRGSSVFTLSERGATSEAAKWLADRENSADLLGGVDLKTNDDVLANVLLNMSQNATLEHSGEAAGAVLRNLSRLGDTHRGQVQKAGFVVLKSPDIPSMLVETAFISNPEEEARLTTPAHQQHLAEAILAGIKAYFRKFPPPGAGVATASARGGRTHVVQSGETLSGIAERYRVGLSSLRKANRLEGDHIRVGQALTLPEGG
ncbi:MAG: N-acetylmuramoyl-L-alanine amidase [Bdellovibrio bacteriovorus]